MAVREPLTADRRVKLQFALAEELPDGASGASIVSGVTVVCPNQDGELSYLYNEDPSGCVIQVFRLDEANNELIGPIVQTTIDNHTVGEEVEFVSSSHDLDLLSTPLPRFRVVNRGAELPEDLTDDDITVNFPAATDTGGPIANVLGRAEYVPGQYVHFDDATKDYRYLFCEGLGDILDIQKDLIVKGFTAIGTVQGGSATTLDLDPLDPYGSDTYTDYYVKLTHGPGRGQVRRIIEHTNNPPRLTIDTPWISGSFPQVGVTKYEIREYEVLNGTVYPGRLAIRFRHPQRQDGGLRQITATVVRYFEPRKNSLLFTEEFDRTDVWADDDTPAKRTVGKTDPTGGMGAVEITFVDTGDSMVQSFKGLRGEVSGDFTFSLWLRAETTMQVSIKLVANAQNQNNVITLTPTWTRYSVTGLNFNSGGAPLEARIDPIVGNLKPFEVWGGQVEVNSYMTPYESVADYGQGRSWSVPRVMEELLGHRTAGMGQPTQHANFVQAEEDLGDLLLTVQGAIPDLFGQAGTVKDILDELASYRGLRYFLNGSAWDIAVDQVTPYLQIIKADAPTAYWPLRERGGSYAYDCGNARLTGAYLGGYSLGVAGPLVHTDDVAAKFNGTDAFVRVSANAAMNLGDLFTYAAWIRRTSTGLGGDVLIMGGDNATAATFRIDSSDRLKIARGSTAIATSLGKIVDTLWHHVVWTKNLSANHIYVDGQDVTGTVTNLAIGGTMGDFSIAGATTGLKAPLEVAHVSIYTAELTPLQVRTQYQAGLGKLVDGVVGDGATPWRNIRSVGAVALKPSNTVAQKLRASYAASLGPTSFQPRYPYQQSVKLGDAGPPTVDIRFRFLARHRAASVALQYRGQKLLMLRKEWPLTLGQIARNAHPADKFQIDVPRRQPENLLAWSENFDQSAWEKLSGTTVTANASRDPTQRSFGADLLQNGSNISVQQWTTVNPMHRYVRFRLWMRTPSGTETVRLSVLSEGGTPKTLDAAVHGVWNQYEVAGWFGATDANRLGVQILGLTGVPSLYVSKPHLVIDYGEKPYVRTTDVAVQAENIWQIVRINHPNIGAAECAFSPWRPRELFKVVPTTHQDANRDDPTYDPRFVPPDVPTGFNIPPHDPPPASGSEAGAGVSVGSDGSVVSWALVEWLMPARAARCQLYRRRHGEQNWEIVTVVEVGQVPVGSQARVTASGFVPGIEYDLTVAAVNAYGLTTTTTFKSFVARGDRTAPPPPTALTVRQGTGRLIEAEVVLPDPPVNDYGFTRLYRRTTDTATPNTTITENDLVDRARGTKLTDVNASYDTDYYLWVRGEDFSGNKGLFFPNGNGVHVKLDKIDGLAEVKGGIQVREIAGEEIRFTTADGVTKHAAIDLTSDIGRLTWQILSAGMFMNLWGNAGINLKATGSPGNILLWANQLLMNGSFIKTGGTPSGTPPWKLEVRDVTGVSVLGYIYLYPS